MYGAPNCRNGSECYYQKKGKCWYSHPKKNQQNLSWKNQSHSLNQESTQQFQMVKVKKLSKVTGVIKTQQQIQKQKPRTKIIKGVLTILVKPLRTLIGSNSWHFENLQHFHHVQQCHYKQCSICLNDFQKYDLVTLLYCQHAFHHQCIAQCLKATDKCPLCRKNFKQHEQFKTKQGFPQFQQKKSQLLIQRRLRLAYW